MIALYVLWRKLSPVTWMSALSDPSSAKSQIAPRPMFQFSSNVPARTVVLLVNFR